MITRVKRLLPLAVLVSLLGVGTLARADSRESAPVGRAPGPSRGGVAASAARLYEHVRKSVVLLERAGMPPAVGTVLGGDGRILTSMSALRGAELLSVRYSDGTTVRAAVSDADPVGDLALLQPEAGRGGVWLEGLAASETDPVGAPLRVMHPAPGMRLGAAEALVRRRVDVWGRDGQPLPSRLDVEVPVPGISGAPLVDRSGGVVGVLTRACADPGASARGPAPQAGGVPPAAMGAEGGCRPVLVGAPVEALRAFLLRAGTRTVAAQSMREPPPPAPTSADVGRTVAARTSAPPWLGIRGEAADKGTGVHGVRVVAVAPSSPAEKAGLKAGVDVIGSVDGQPVDAPEKLAEMIASRAAGDTIQLLVLSGSELRTIQVVLTRQE